MVVAAIVDYADGILRSLSLLSLRLREASSLCRARIAYRWEKTVLHTVHCCATVMVVSELHDMLTSAIELLLLLLRHGCERARLLVVANESGRGMERKKERRERFKGGDKERFWWHTFSRWEEKGRKQQAYEELRWSLQTEPQKKSWLVVVAFMLSYFILTKEQEKEGREEIQVG